jgi:hypothetical protein
MRRRALERIATRQDDVMAGAKQQMRTAESAHPSTNHDDPHASNPDTSRQSRPRSLVYA